MGGKIRLPGLWMIHFEVEVNSIFIYQIMYIDKIRHTICENGGDTSFQT